MKALVVWFLLAMIGSGVLLAGSFVLGWFIDDFIPSLKARRKSPCVDEIESKKTVTHVYALLLLVLVYVSFLAVGLYTRLTLVLIMSQGFYILIWGAILTRIDKTYYQRERDGSSLELQYDDSQVERRLRIANASFFLFMIMVVAIIASWLSPALASYWVVTGRVVGPSLLWIVVFIISIVPMLWLEKRYGPSTIDRVFDLMQQMSAAGQLRVNNIPGSAIPLSQTINQSQAELGIKLLLQVEEHVCAGYFKSAQGETLDLMEKLPTLVKDFIEDLKRLDKPTALRYEAYVKSLIDRLEKQPDPSRSSQRANQWRMAFSR